MDSASICAEVGLIHGDLDQATRNEILSKFKAQEFRMLVATDVAGVSESRRLRNISPCPRRLTVFFICVARGLDIPSVKIVVSYDIALNLDTHVHRVGRTGRAGR